MALLEAQHLRVEIPTAGGIVVAVQGASFSVERGEVVAIVGESGAGKSTLANALINYLRPPARLAAGSVLFEGHPVSAPAGHTRERPRIGYVVSNAASHLDPLRRIGEQVAGMYELHGALSRREARRVALATLARLNIADPERLTRAYPFQISGGMAQRVVIAMALATKPELLIADEPVSGLDVTLQRQIMEELVALARERAAAVVLITHDLGLAAAYCERVIVMLGGRIVEDAAANTFFAGPQHPYSRRLLESVAAEFAT